MNRSGFWLVGGLGCVAVLGLLLVIHIGLSGCASTEPQIKPPKGPEEYNAPPENDPRYNKPIEYPKDSMEVMVADGMSVDGTRELVEEYAGRDSRVRILDNPQRITPVALNLAIAAVRGEIEPISPTTVIRALLLFATGSD